MLHRVEAIVIRSTDYGEGNKIVTLLTETQGKVGVVARGAKKPKSRFGSATQPFTYGDYSYYRTGGLGTLNQAEVIRSFQPLRESLDLAAYAAYAAELLDRAVPPEEAGTFLFHQLKAALTALEEGKDARIVLRWFEMKIAQAAGYAPQLDQCVQCGAADGPARFSASRGGMLCARCRHLDPGALELEEPVWRLLRTFSALDLRRLGSVSLKPGTQRGLQLALRRWLDTHLGLRLKSQHFLDQLERHGELLGRAAADESAGSGEPFDTGRGDGIE